MGLVKKFVIICLATLALFGVLLGWALTEYIERSHLLRVTDMYASHVAKEARKTFAKADFDPSLPVEAKAAVRERIARFDFGPDTVNARVWSTERVILWAKEPALIGSKFLDDEGLERALTGKTAGDYSNLEKSENRLEPRGERLLEIYVPVFFGGEKAPSAVFEIYCDVSGLASELSSLKMILWGGNLAGVVLLFLSLTGLVAGAAKRIERQHKEIERSEARFRNLLKFANDGVIAIDRERKIVIFNRAAEKLFGIAEPQALGMRLEELLSKASRPDFLGVVEHLGRSKSPIKGLLMAANGLKSSGTVFPIVLSLSTTEGDDSGLILAIVSDQAERQKLGH